MTRYVCPRTLCVAGLSHAERGLRLGDSDRVCVLNRASVNTRRSEKCVLACPRWRLAVNGTNLGHKGGCSWLETWQQGAWASSPAQETWPITFHPLRGTVGAIPWVVTANKGG